MFGKDIYHQTAYHNSPRFFWSCYAWVFGNHRLSLRISIARWITCNAASNSARDGCIPSIYHIKMLLKQVPKPPQFPDCLRVRSGDDGPTAEEQLPHIFENGDSGGDGLPVNCRLPLFHLPFWENMKSVAPNALQESRGGVFGRVPAVFRQLPFCRTEHPSRSEIVSLLFPACIYTFFLSFAASIAKKAKRLYCISMHNNQNIHIFLFWKTLIIHIGMTSYLCIRYSPQ